MQSNFQVWGAMCEEREICVSIFTIAEIFVCVYARRVGVRYVCIIREEVAPAKINGFNLILSTLFRSLRLPVCNAGATHNYHYNSPPESIA